MNRHFLFWLLPVACLLFLPGTGHADRCGTGLRNRTFSVTPTPRRSAARTAAPVAVPGAHIVQTDHFRVLWGDAFAPADPDWSDTDSNGVPDWVDHLADALESAYDAEIDLGFSEPYGVETYYLDAYVANTGLTVDGVTIGLSTNVYAYTQIDPDYAVAYFVFNDDFSAHTNDETGLLRATAAHELFHAIQRVDYPWDDERAVPADRWNEEGWWFEATATWIEEEVTPDVDDYASYVRSFLSDPDEPLASTDGVREYGAAIFPGYLWLHVGGAGLWQSVFTDAYDLGLEGALETALAVGGYPGLIPTLASFWTLAAHPEDGWPDGSLFRSAGAPRMAAVVDGLPTPVEPAPGSEPARFGATLLRVDGVTGGLEVRLETSDPDATWRVAASAAGRGDTQQVELGTGDDPTVWTGAADTVYVAVVNVSDAAGTRAFRARLDTLSSSESTGGGGCFLESVGSR